MASVDDGFVLANEKAGRAVAGRFGCMGRKTSRRDAQGRRADRGSARPDRSPLVKPGVTTASGLDQFLAFEFAALTTTPTRRALNYSRLSQVGLHLDQP